jgi:two-component system nitrogen regulation response regulator NtrX
MNLLDLNQYIIDHNINASIISDSFNDDILREYNFFKTKIKLKSLNFRTDEIFNIFSHYLNLFSTKLLNKKLTIHDAVKEKIMSYDWPGNVFQIMNITENIVKNIDVTKDIISSSDVDLYINDTQNDNNLYNLNYKDAKDSFEREYLMNKLKLNSWNVTKTALSLNLDRVSLYRKIKSLKINLTE